MSFSVRRLTADDAASYRDIRLESLRTEPFSFGRTFEEDAALPPEKWSERLSSRGTFGVFLDAGLVGIATLAGEDGMKVKHRAHLYGVYLKPEARGTGASDLLLRAVIEEAGKKYLQLHLVVAANVPRSIRFYERLGFVRYGTDPRGLLSEGQYIDDYLMVLRLD